MSHNALSHIKGFIITAAHETARQDRVQQLMQLLPGIQQMEAVYPSLEKVPFLTKLQALSKQRTGHALKHGEIGVLLSSRKIWHRIVQEASSDTEAFLVLESDSWMNDPAVFGEYYSMLTQQYDMFFFGSWLGRTRIFRSTRKQLDKGFVYGTPFIKTISGGYGYALNRKAAQHLLERSGKIAFPVDEFKRYIEPGYLRIGAVLPELISEKAEASTIGERPQSPDKQKLKMILLDIRNTVIAYCK
ncbi:MAG TPA: hypothetical protein DIW54_12845 [Chitinophagaceae bacterium]|nr:hypothetical protein [Chitinophagaceae bacterium]